MNLVLPLLIFLTGLTALPLRSGEVPSSFIANEVLSAGPTRDYFTRSVGVEVTASSTVVIDFTSGEVLFSQDMDTMRPIASISKLMTALVFLDHNPGWDTEVTMETRDEVYRAKYVYRGETITVRDLWYITLVGSDNNATMALVRSTGMGLTQFVRAMNEKAAVLGLVHTTFVDPTGLSAGNRSTARDIVGLAQAAWEKEDIMSATSANEYRLSVGDQVRSQRIPNTNKLLGSYLKVEAGKTGFIDESGYCLVAKIQHPEDKGSIMVVVLGSATEPDRFQDAKALAWWTFGNYIWQGDTF